MLPEDGETGAGALTVTNHDTPLLLRVGGPRLQAVLPCGHSVASPRSCLLELECEILRCDNEFRLFFSTTQVIIIITTMRMKILKVKSDLKATSSVLLPWRN